MTRTAALLLTCAALFATAAAAQEPPPGGDEPSPRLGTTVIGERESPIGLYITPWRRSAPEPGLDRPARLLAVEAEPVDREVYRRQVEYHGKLAEARAANIQSSRNP